ncbi:hypothetical protein L9F63_003234 [Diploptera punctata]|uniref:Uncharacterized protein n=1 Tax=Diploptera punctata TaxID=6984 RepID=A0AAD7ZLA1_DIPPU|nr:hypothetical protein L9F63_003234 [Diploptera punctata]
MKVRQFCCGCSLRTGAIIVGVVETLGGLIEVILYIVAAAEAEPDPREKENILDALDTIRVSNIILAGVTIILTILSALIILGVKLLYTRTSWW